MKIAAVFQKIKRAYSVLAEHKFTTVAGTLVFFLIMSFVPFSFWLVLLFGNAVNLEDIARLELFDWAKELLAFIGKNASGATSGANVFLLATTLWSSTGFFYHLRRSGEIVYRCRRPVHGWKVRLSAAVFTFAVLFFFAAAGAALIGTSLVASYLPSGLSYVAVYSLVLCFGFFAAWLLNAYICPYRSRPHETVLGSLLTAIAWLLASVAFSIYLHFSDPERLYGALSLVIVFLLWLYWMMICFTAGVIFNKYQMTARVKERKTL